jgi:hypothetical protein
MTERKTYVHNLAPARAGWVKHPASPVLGGDLGTCFDLTMIE